MLFFVFNLTVFFYFTQLKDNHPSKDNKRFTEHMLTDNELNSYYC